MIHGKFLYQDIIRREYHKTHNHFLSVNSLLWGNGQKMTTQAPVRIRGPGRSALPFAEHQLRTNCSNCTARRYSAFRLTRRAPTAQKSVLLRTHCNCVRTVSFLGLYLYPTAESSARETLLPLSNCVLSPSKRAAPLSLFQAVGAYRSR